MLLVLSPPPRPTPSCSASNARMTGGCLQRAPPTKGVVQAVKVRQGGNVLCQRGELRCVKCKEQVAEQRRAWREL